MSWQKQRISISIFALSVLVVVCSAVGLFAGQPQPGRVEQLLSIDKTEILDQVELRPDGKRQYTYDCDVKPGGDVVVLKHLYSVPEIFVAKATIPEPKAYLLTNHRNPAWEETILQGYTGPAAMLGQEPRLLVTPSGRVVVAWLDAGAAKADYRPVQLMVRWVEDPAGAVIVRKISDSDPSGVSSFDVAAGTGDVVEAVWTDDRDTHFGGWSHMGLDNYKKVFARTINLEGGSLAVFRVDPKKRKYIAYGVVASQTSEGAFYALWDQLVKGSWNLVLSVRDSGVWKAPTRVASNDSTHSYYTVLPLPNDSAMVVWVSPSRSQELLEKTYTKGTLSGPSVVAPSGCCPAAVMTSDGVVHLVYQDAYPWDRKDHTTTPIGPLYYARKDSQGWGRPQVIAENVLLGSADIKLDGQGRRHLFWQSQPERTVLLVHSIAGIDKSHGISGE